MPRWTPLLVVVALSCCLGDARAQFQSSDDQVARGRELFLHQWQPGDKLSPHGDGLGPLYNATSCVACHHQGGVGGGGPNEHNAQMLAFIPEGRVRSPEQFLKRLQRIHPHFVDNEGNFVYGVLLHRYSTTPGYDDIHKKVTAPLQLEGPSNDRVQRMLRARNLSFATELPLQLVSFTNEIQLAIAERNPPPLYGLDLIDKQIKESDLDALVEAQQLSQTGVSGRKVEKFGWRAQLPRLEDFVKGACAAELGLQVYEMSQAPDPLRPDYELFGNDLTLGQTSDLVAFVRSLPRPEQVLPDDPNQRSQVARGEQLFATIGCNECHVENVGGVEGVYSDFLIHNMGSEFEDPIPAKAVEPTVVTLQYNESGILDVSMPGYYGSDRQVPYRLQMSRTEITEVERNHHQEFRTAPLWGVADSAPYLHDGRAETLREAIEWHGGEAMASVQAYHQLSAAQQESLIRFLESLKAPQSAEPAPEMEAEKAEEVVQDAEPVKLSAVSAAPGLE